MITSILAPLDGSDEAEAGLAWAKTAARISGAAVHLLSVVSEDGPPPANQVATAEEYLRRHTEELGDRGISVHTEVACGSPTEVILARSAVSELTVLTHGTTKWLFGRSLDVILREMCRPVLVVRPMALQAGAALEHRRMLVPLDQGAFSRSILQTAEMLARALKLSIVLCHFVKPVGPYLNAEQAPPGIASEIEALIAVASSDLERQALPLSNAGISVEIVVCMGDPLQEIVRLAERCKAGVIAMATRGSASLSRVMGSTAHGVLRSTRVPCLLVRPDAEQPAQQLESAAVTA